MYGFEEFSETDKKYIYNAENTDTDYTYNHFVSVYLQK